MVKKCVVFVYLCNLDLSIPCAPLEPVKKLTNKQTRKAEKRNNNKKQKNKTKQTNQKKQRRNRRKAFIDFFQSIFQYILYLQICEFKREL